MNILKRVIRKSLIILLLITGVIFKSCDYSYIEGLDNINEYTYSPVIAIPLINSSLAIDDLIGIENYDEIYVDEENLIWFVYKGRVLTVPANELFMIRNQSSISSFMFNPVQSGHSQVIEHDFYFSFENGALIESIKFLSGLLTVELNAPELLAAGYSISNSFEILNSVGNSRGQSIGGRVTPAQRSEVDISGSTINFKYPENFFTIRHTITTTGSGNPARAPFSVTVRKNISNIRYEVIRGFMGTVAFPIGGTTVSLDIFDNFDLGNTFFEAPRIDVLAHNSFGVPLNLEFTDFFASNTRNQRVNLTGDGFQNPWRISNAVTEGEKVTTTAQLNRQNSNMDEIAAIDPNKFFYFVNGVANPDEPGINFIRHDSGLFVDAEVFLPFWGRVQNLEIADTLENPINNITDEIDWIQLNMNITNGFPIDAFVQIYFANANMVKTDSLFTVIDHTNFIKAASVEGSTGLVTTPQFKNTKIMLDQNKIESLRNSPNLIVNATLETYNQQEAQSVKILDNYRLDLKVGIRAQPKVIEDFGR